jgi:hypothetical protein
MGRGEHEETTALIAASHAIPAREQPTTVRRVVYELFNQKKITVRPARPAAPGPPAGRRCQSPR